MNGKKNIIWLDDNPEILEKEVHFLLKVKQFIENKFNLLIWNGQYCVSETRGKKCLEDFRQHITQFLDTPEKVAGFIIDVRIPVHDLSVLGLSHIQTQQGLITGTQIVSSYLRNKEGESELGDKFLNTPILLLSITSQVDDKILRDNANIIFVCKTHKNALEQVETWLNNLN